MSSRRRVVLLVLALMALVLPPTAAADAAVDISPAPLLTTQETIGTSVLGRAIVAVHRSRQSGDGTTGARRTLLVVGNVHGDEQAGLRVISLLRTRTDLPANLDLWLVPTANPDGTSADTRTNAHGVDLNRNFPYRWGRGPKGPTWGGPAPWSEPESRALRDLVLRVQPDVMVVFHQPLFGVGASDKGPAIARAVARGMALPVRNFVCTGVCHGTFGSWLDHATPGLAVIAEFGHRVRSWRIGRAAATVVRVAAGAPSTALAEATTRTVRTAGWWRAGRLTSWQIQLQGPVHPDSPSLAAQVVEVDGKDTPVATVRRLHARGARRCCAIPTPARGRTGGPTPTHSRPRCSARFWTAGRVSAGSTSAGSACCVRCWPSGSRGARRRASTASTTTTSRAMPTTVPRESRCCTSSTT